MNCEMLSLRNFKCHANLDLPLNSLTVLTGFNSAGKSSIQQAFALLAQSVAGDNLPAGLQLNGPLVNLGVMGDVLNMATGSDAFEIGLTTDEGAMNWRFSGDRRNSSPKTEIRSRTSETGKQALVEFFRNIVYLTTERPAVTQTWSITKEESQLKIGANGEGAVPLLYALDQFPVTPTLCISDVPPTLPRQVEAHMGKFFPGFSMDIQPAAGTNNVLTLGLRTSDKGEFHSPANVGFGLFYLLPIVTALLHTKPGQMLIIETPEAHIHPSAQSLMATFLARVAATGVQIVVETHSDHLINGVRRAVKANLLAHDAVVIHFFSGQQGEASKSASVMIDPTGNLGDWPAGFCDQYDQDLAHLTGWGTTA
ncbi:MAG: AAA family ATPase [Kiritimatiellia bacterium]